MARTEGLTTHGYAMIRCPAIPMSMAARLGNALKDISADRKEIRGEILLSDRRIATALQAGAPDFYYRLTAKAVDLSSADEISVFKYITRMATRCTPFAGFAGVGLVDFNCEESPLDPANSTCLVRLDSAVLTSLHEEQKKKTIFGKSLLVRRNPTSLLVSDQFRYYERKYAGGGFHFVLAKASRTIFLDCLMSQTALIVRSIGELVKALQEIDSEIEDEEAFEFIEETIRAGLLELAIDVSMFGSEPVCAYISSLSSFHNPEWDGTTEKLKKIYQVLQEKESYSLEETIEVSSKIGLLLEGGAGHRGRKSIIHTDTFFPTSSTSLPVRFLEQLERAISIVEGLIPRPRNEQLETFARNFERRFGDQFIPLVHALDSELGIPYGFSSPIIPWVAGLGLAPKNAPPPKFGFDQILHGMTSVSVLEIDLAELGLAKSKPSTSRTFSANVTLYQTTCESDPFGYLHYISSPGSVNLLTRFAARYEPLCERVAVSAKIDSGVKGAILAEIVHTPHPRTGNVLARPAIFSHYILLTGQGPSCDNTLAMDDLFVGVQNGRILIWSKSLDQEIVPRSNSAYNYQGPANLALYQFLCAVGKQGAIPTFRWPPSLDHLKVTPRVRCGQIVLLGRRWMFDATEIKMIASFAGDGDFAGLREFLHNFSLPSFFTYDEGDQKLEIDVGIDISLAMFASVIKNLPRLFVYESAARIGDPWVKTNDGSYHSEMVIPLTQITASSAVPKPTPVAIGLQPRIRGEADRKKVWRFIKIYAGEVTLHDLLVSRIGPFLISLVENGEIEHWHFVRYGDPNFHFRVRVYGERASADASLNRILQDMVEPMIDGHIIHSYSIEPYIPEVRRYGGADLIRLAEIIFHIDSQFACRVLSMEGARYGDLVWQAVLLGILKTLRVVLKNDDDAIRQFIEIERNKYKNELDLGDSQYKGIAKRYRLARDFVLGAVENIRAENEVLATYHDIRVEMLTNELNANSFLLEKDVLPHSFITGIVHMFANRLFTAPSRHQEFLVFEYLSRAIREKKARNC